MNDTASRQPSTDHDDPTRELEIRYADLAARLGNVERRQEEEAAARLRLADEVRTQTGTLESRLRELDLKWSSKLDGVEGKVDDLAASMAKAISGLKSEIQDHLDGFNNRVSWMIVGGFFLAIVVEFVKN